MWVSVPGVMWACLPLVRVYLCLAGCGHMCLRPVERADVCVGSRF